MSEATPEQTNIIDAILDLKRKEPFQHFKIGLTSGKEYRIESGENLVEMKSDFFYATPGGESFTFIRKNQIASVSGVEPRRRSKRRAL